MSGNRPSWSGTVLESCIRDVAIGRIAAHSSVTAEMVAEWRRRNLASATASPAIRPVRPETGPSGIGGRSRDDLRASGGAEGDSGTSNEEGL